MDAIRIQKEVSDQHAENVKIQGRISRQQELSSIIQSVATWRDFHPQRSIHKTNWTYFDLEYLRARFVNLKILEVTRNRMLETPEHLTNDQYTTNQCMELGAFYFDVSEMIFAEVARFFSQTRGVNDTQVSWDAALDLVTKINEGKSRFRNQRLSISLTAAKHTFLMEVDKLMAAFTKELKTVAPKGNLSAFSLIANKVLSLSTSYSDVMGNCFDFDSWVIDSGYQPLKDWDSP